MQSFVIEMLILHSPTQISLASTPFAIMSEAKHSLYSHVKPWNPRQFARISNWYSFHSHKWFILHFRWTHLPVRRDCPFRQLNTVYPELMITSESYFIHRAPTIPVPQRKIFRHPQNFALSGAKQSSYFPRKAIVASVAFWSHWWS